MSFIPGKQLEPATISLGDLLRGSFFEIPINQRDYEWLNSQREKLWNDIEQAIKHDCHDYPNKPLGHFLGAIVVVGPERPHESDRWKIIDGQQRITTFTILVDCLRIFAEKIEDKKTSKRLTRALDDCLKGTSTGEPPRLTLNRYNEFYQGSMQQNETWEEKQAYWTGAYVRKYKVHKNIKEAYEFFFAKISAYLEFYTEDEDENITDLVEIVIEHLYVLRVRTENFNMAYRLFETLNARGLDLSQADLIKNELIKYANAKDEGEQVSDVWLSLVDDYEEQPKEWIDLPQFVQFSYSHRYRKINHEDTYERISEALRNGEHDALKLVREFKEDSEGWLSFLFGDLTSWPDSLEDSQEAILNILWKQHCAPFIMAAMNRFSNDVDKLHACIRYTEHYLFRQGLVCRDSVDVLQRFFSKVANMLQEDFDLTSIREQFCEYSPDSVFKEQFKTYSAKNMKQGFYAVWKIEHFLHKGIEVSPRTQGVGQHLEHIMPKKLGGDWSEIDKQEGFKNHLNRIGNLMVLGAEINQHIRNSSIAYKMSNGLGKSYSSSSMRLAKEFLEKFDEWAPNGQWNFESINRRQAHLAESYAIKVWKFE